MQRRGALSVKGHRAHPTPLSAGNSEINRADLSPPPLQLKPPSFRTRNGWPPVSVPPLIVRVVGVVMPLPFKFNVPPEITNALVIVQAPVTVAAPPLNVLVPPTIPRAHGLTPPPQSI